MDPDNLCNFICFDFSLNFELPISKVVQSCFYHLSNVAKNLFISELQRHRIHHASSHFLTFRLWIGLLTGNNSQTPDCAEFSSLTTKPWKETILSPLQCLCTGYQFISESILWFYSLPLWPQTISLNISLCSHQHTVWSQWLFLCQSVKLKRTEFWPLDPLRSVISKISILLFWE